MSATMQKHLELIVRGGAVKRYHSRTTVVTETVAAHSYLVAWIVDIIVVSVRAELLLAALQHDIAEYKTGDVPAPTKRAMGLNDAFDAYESTVLDDHYHPVWVQRLTPEEQWALKRADVLAGMIYCTEERRLGSRMLVETFNNYARYYRQEINDKAKGWVITQAEVELYNTVLENWKDANS